MLTFEHFSINWTADGNDLFYRTTFLSCTVDFIHRAIPKISMKVETKYPENITTISDTNLTLVFEDNTTMELSFFVFSRTHLENVFTLVGFACTSDFMKYTRNAYLGNSLDSAINKVSDVFKLNFKTSVSGEFYQLNETNCQCLLRLLKGCSDSQSFEFTNDSIELIDDSEEFELKMGTREAINFNFVTENDTEPIIEPNTDYYNQGWNLTQVYESSSEQYIRNVLSTIKYERAFDILITSRYQGVPACIVGGKAKIEFPDLTFKSFTIVGKIITASSNKNITTDLILGVNK